MTKLHLQNQELMDKILSVHIHQHIGISLDSVSNCTSQPPTVRAFFLTTARHLTPSNSLHGGIMELCLDSVTSMAVIPTLESGKSAATVASSFQLIGNVAGQGRRIELEGRVVKRGRRLFFCEGVATCEGKVLARGMITKTIIPGLKETKGKL